MRRDRQATNNTSDSPGAKANKKSFAATPVIVVISVALLATAFLLVNSYKGLGRAIQQERIDYVDEISTQLINSHHFMMDEYAASVLRFSEIVNRSKAKSLDEIAAYFTYDDASNIMLISEAGGIVDLNGKQYFATGDRVVEELCRNNGVTQMFTSLNNERDFWLFSAAIEPLQIEEQRYRTVVLAVPASAYGEMLATSFFGNLGASYIIGIGGSIELMPENAGLIIGGYNLFSSLSQVGVGDDQIDKLKAAVAQRRDGSMLLDIQGQDWLFSHSSVDMDNAIVVAIPLTLTAAQTYSGLAETLALMAAAIALIALIALAIILRFIHRDRERRRKVMIAETKSNFFSKMSHDIRTPLNAIIGLHALIKGSSDIAEIKEYNQRANSASTYLLSILNDVLDMSRIEGGAMPLAHEPFDINLLLSDVSILTRGIANDRGVAFSEEIDGAFNTLYVGDEVRIQQILVNLLNNAVKFTEPQGRVSLQVSHIAKDARHDEIVFRIQDTGIGMSERFMQKMFQPFEQEQSSLTKQYSGSGLGLSIVHNLVTMMGGTITVQSQLDKGSAFTVVLPLERGESISKSVPANEDEPEQTPSYAGKRVLLAEDNEINRLVASQLLMEVFDVEVETAADGAQAVSKFAKSDPGYYALILMDIKMPNMDGLAAARAIRALPRPDAKSIPIIALSANAYSEDVALSIRAGMNDHLAKPIDMQALSIAFGKYVNISEEAK